MLEKFTYTNHQNEVLDFGKAPLFVNENDLRDFAWNITSKNNRISGFKKGIVSKTIPIILKCNSEADGISLRNRLFEVFEKDVLAQKHGKIQIGDYYLRCYITGSKKTQYLLHKNYMVVSLTVQTDHPEWVKETTTALNMTNSNGGYTGNNITDLTNTTWQINEGWLATIGYGQFNIIGTVNDSVDLDGGLYIGYGLQNTSPFYKSAENQLVVCCNNDSLYRITNTSSFTLTITGGEDVDNKWLINWLCEHGELLTSEQIQDVTLTEPVFLDYPYDFSYDFKNQFVSANIFNEAFTPSNFVLTIEGHVNTPTLFINDHKYSVNVIVGDGERLVIDSVNKTITLIKGNEQTNCYNDRCRDSYIFEKIPSGWSVVASPSGDIRCTLTLLEERSEPKWT